MYFGRLRLDSLTLSILLASQILLLFWKVRPAPVTAHAQVPRTF